MTKINNRCLIFSAAPIHNYNKIVQVIDLHKDYIICADAGYLHAKNMDIIPNMVLGDFDSYTQPIDFEINVVRYSSEKDDTDTMIAIKLALEKGFSDICLIGAIGGEDAHSYANIQAMNYIVNRGSTVVCYANNAIFRVIKDSHVVLTKEQGKYLSVFSYSDSSDGVSVQGAKYKLHDALLTNDFPLGVSNEIIENTARVCVKRGTLLIITSEDSL
ncbi:MAG: thiamine diphosphokinase [Oscillospiraceae bacterium]